MPQSESNSESSVQSRGVWVPAQIKQSDHLFRGVLYPVNQTTPDKVSSAWCGPDHTVPCHSQPCQFVRVHAPAAYGGNMLSGELVSWPGLPSPGTDGGSLGPEEQLRCSRYSAPLCPLTLALPVCLVASFLTAPPHMPRLLCVLVDSDLIGFPSKLNGKETKCAFDHCFITHLWLRRLRRYYKNSVFSQELQKRKY